MTKQEFLQVAEWIADGVCEFESFYGTWVGPEKKWTISMDDSFSSFRRKPQPAPPVYRAWNAAECREAVGKVVEEKGHPEISGQITARQGTDVCIAGVGWRSASNLLESWTYLDGTTCGVLTNPETSA